jgi:long-subunit acyl-CoA synthetase (AMP-forming)
MGEIYIGGPELMSGYYKQPELTSKVLRRHENIPDKPLLYKTGDLGYWDQNGEVVFVGRGDFQVKIRGQRLELGKIEAVVSSIDGISSSLVVKKTDVEKDRTDQLSTEFKSVCQNCCRIIWCPSM